MIKDLSWLSLAKDMDVALRQSMEEGQDVSMLSERVRAIVAMPDSAEREALAMRLYEEMSARPSVPGYAYCEPDSLEGIRRARPPQAQQIPIFTGDRDVLQDKIYGAWLGRCCGCLLGQPVEGWRRERIVRFLQATDNYPPRYYMSSELPDDIRNRYGIVDEQKVYGGWHVNWINHVVCMPEDDDMNYTTLALKLFERHGLHFTSENVAEMWMDSLPSLHLCTAERVAYRNLLNRVSPPESATVYNPYREWIGAQIRADLYGYITPGKPADGAEMAFRDACISHTKNGVYGAMFVAAMLSAAAVLDCPESIIRVGLAQIPEKSRLHEAVERVLEAQARIHGWEAAVQAVHDHYDEANSHDWCHTIPNAMLVCTALLYGQMDFEKSIGMAVSAGFDTDCNAATVGSLVGMVHGANRLPAKWTNPLHDKLTTGVHGFTSCRISDLAKRTCDIACE